MAAESYISLAERHKSQLFAFYEIRQPDTEYWKGIKNYLSKERTNEKKGTKKKNKLLCIILEDFHPSPSKFYESHKLVGD